MKKFDVLDLKFVISHQPAVEVWPADIDHVKAIAPAMIKLCGIRRGRYDGGKAIAHPQICPPGLQPLRFFVMADGQIVINPEILSHTRHTVDSREGCLSFPNRPPIIVQRWNKIEVEYFDIDFNENKPNQRL